jgi:hypothetical protein
MLVATTLTTLLSPFTHAGDDDPDPGLLSRLARIEAAFRQGSAGALRDSCVTSGRVRLDLESVAVEQGSYGTGQVQVIFGQIFEQYRTSAFVFARDDVKVSAPGTAFARSRWSRRGRGGSEAVDTLTFTLHQEGGDWRVHEIRSSR